MTTKKKLKKQVKLLTRVCDWYSDKLDELYAEIERLSPKDVPEPHAPDDLPTCILKGESIMDSCSPSDDGWVAWDGDKRWVPVGVIEVCFQDRDIPSRIANAEEFDWSHIGWRSDIIKYRRIQEAPDSRSERHTRAVAEEGE